MDNRLYNKHIIIRSLAILALLGSSIGAITFDYDHLLALWIGIKEGRFLHHPTAILYCAIVVFLSWWIIKLVRRLHN